jgi:hypothetical protein
VSKSTFQMQEILGQFLRYLHYILIVSLNEGAQTANKYPTGSHRADQEARRDKGGGKYFDRLTYIAILKLLQSLLQLTPYHLMREGLASIAMKQLIGNLQLLNRLNNKDQTIRNEICMAINQLLAKPDLVEEIRSSFFDEYQQCDLCETLISTVFKINNYTSNEKIQILQTIGKNYPEILTKEWLRAPKNGGMPKIQFFFQISLERIERKK